MSIPRPAQSGVMQELIPKQLAGHHAACLLLPGRSAEMKTLVQLQEERAALVGRAEAIRALCDDENREPTADENAEFDRIMGAGDKPGEVDRIDGLIDREQKLQTIVSKKAVTAATQQRTDADDPAKKAVIQAISKQRHGAIRGFDSREAAFDSGCWLFALLGHGKAKEYAASRGVSIQAAMSEGSPAGGGFLVPEQFEAAVIRLVLEYGVFRNNIRMLPMSSDKVLFPRRTAGVTSYYVAEAGTATTESSPTVGQAELVAKKIAVRTLISDDLLEDAIIDVINFVVQEVALAIAQAEDTAGFTGTGLSATGGITGLIGALAAGSIHTALTGNTAFSTLDSVDFTTMAGKLPTYARMGAKWYISPAGYWDSMARLQMAAGGNNTMDFGNGPVLMYAGYPVVLTEVANSTLSAQTSTNGLCYFGNLMQAGTMGVRRGITLQILRERYAELFQIGVLVSQRYDINIHERGTASVAGPMLMLATPAS